MDYESLREEIATETERLLKKSDAHIVLTIVIGKDGGMTECSSAMDEPHTVLVLQATTKAIREVLPVINAMGSTRAHA